MLRKSYVSPSLARRRRKSSSPAYVFRLVFEATDGKAVVLAEVAAAHVGATAAEVVAVRVVVVLGRTPEVRAVAEIVVLTAVVEAGRKCREARGVVARGVVPHSTGFGTASPARSGGKRLGYARA